MFVTTYLLTIKKIHVMKFIPILILFPEQLACRVAGADAWTCLDEAPDTGALRACGGPARCSLARGLALGVAPLQKVAVAGDSS